MAFVCDNKRAAGSSQMKTLWDKSSQGDERWVYEYDMETKRQSSQWKSADSPRPKKARQARSKVKVMLVVFFDMEGILHYEYVSQGQTVNQQFYLQVLKRLRLVVSCKRPGRYITTVHQHTQHTPSRYFWQVMAFLSFRSSDMAPCDFWLFPQLKTVLKGKKFEDIDAIKTNTSTLNTIPNTLYKNISTSGRTAGSNVSAHKESILKTIEYF